jgi:hypothetical protein
MEEADNYRCEVCHINFVFDSLTTNHAAAGIGCESCHGASDDHCSDEDNIIPPEIMYPLSQLNNYCMECHEQQILPAEDHETLFAGTADSTEVCTDCHGDHRLTVRTRRWDRVTGELIESDGVRMLQEGERDFMEE